MDLKEAMQKRHSVRSFTNGHLPEDTVEVLTDVIEECNRESGLHIQLALDEPEAFDCRRARYGHFSGVNNYVAMIGKKSPKLEEQCGYYGERIVLEATMLGLNTCWVAMTYRKVLSAFSIADDERLVIVIALGYGTETGLSHKSKAITEISDYADGSPDWYKAGLEAALLAPTAVNQQKFRFRRDGQKVTAQIAGFGPCTKIDLGIVKYHFEVGAGKNHFSWA